MKTTLRKALMDPQLLGAHALWPGQDRVVEEIDNGARTLVIPWGRRGGKTAIASLVAVWTCLLRDDLNAYMKPGERRWAVVVATNVRQARVSLDAARAAVEHSPMLRGLIEASTTEELRFKNGTGIRVMPCSSQAGRGFPISCLVLDEYGHFQDDTEGFRAADRIWQAMTPSLTQFQGEGIVLVPSTPFGADNAFASLYERVQDGKLGADAVGFRLTTAEANPQIPAEFLESKESELGEEGFRQEYLAEFLASGNAFIDLDRVAVEREGELGTHEHGCVDLVAGLDPSFSGSGDAFGLVIVGTATSRLGLHRLIYADAQRLPRGKSGFEAHMGAIAGALRMYGVRQAVTDQYAADAVVERLEREGITTKVNHMGPESKTHAFNTMRGMLYSGGLELYQHPQLLTELGRLRTRFSPGKASVYNPRVGGSHGDIAQALAIAADHIAARGNEAPSFVSIRPGSPNYVGGREPELEIGGMKVKGARYVDRQEGDPPHPEPPAPRRAEPAQPLVSMRSPFAGMSAEEVREAVARGPEHQWKGRKR